MSTLAGDFWVCGDCRSINNAGARQCYNCRTPRDRAAVDPNTIDPSAKGPLRTIELPQFNPSRWAAMLATILIIAVAVMQVVQFNLSAQLINQVLAGTDPTDEQLVFVGSVGILSFGMGLLALIAWSLWLSRTVTSMPALGLGYPAANGMMAFYENFIPVLNLYRVPAIVRDVVRRLEPKAGGDETMTRGEALIFAAWIGLIGGFFIPRVLGFLNRDVGAVVPISGIATGFVLVGAIFLIVLIWWIEGKVLRRREAQLAEAGGSAAPAEAEPSPTPDPAFAAAAAGAVQTRSAFAAVAGATAGATGSFRLPPTEEGATIPSDDAPLTAAGVAAVAPRAEGSPTEAPVDTPLSPIVDTPPAVVATPPAEVTAAVAPVAVDSPSPAVEEAITAAPAEPVLPREAAIAVVETQDQAIPAPHAPPAAAEPMPSAPASAEPPPAAAPVQATPPNLTIRISSRGLMTAELDGEVEHVMLDDLGPYAEALSHVGGTATLHVPPDETMPGLIARRAQKILEDAGVRVTLA